jgi:hypothetical protein
MNDASTTTRDHADEEILTATVSDDALEAAAGPESGACNMTTARPLTNCLTGQ